MNTPMGYPLHKRADGVFETNTPIGGLHEQTAARFEEEGRRGFPNRLQPYKEGTMAATRWAAGFESARRLYVADVDAQTQDTIDLPAMPETLAKSADACEQEARTIEEIAYCLRVWNVATWQGWTIIRIPGVTARSVRIEATEACGTVHLRDYPARTGAIMPFDNHDVRRLLLPIGAVLAR